MTNTNQQKETETKMPKWKCIECDCEFYGLSIVCPSCENANVEKIEE